MTILGRGDLSPRRRQRHTGRLLAVVVIVVLVLAAAGYVGYRELHHGATRVATSTTRPCRTVDTAAGPAAARTVRLAVRNGTLRTGLAATVAQDLRARGFHVTSIGNARRTVAGMATVTYPAGGRRAAEAVAAQIAGATVRAGSGGLALVVGHDYSGLRSVAAAAAAERAETPTTPAACPAASMSPSAGASSSGAGS